MELDQKHMIGRRFGKLLVVGKAKSIRGGKGSACFQVRCDCGADSVVRASELRNGRVDKCRTCNGGRWRNPRTA